MLCSVSTLRDCRIFFDVPIYTIIEHRNYWMACKPLWSITGINIDTVSVYITVISVAAHFHQSLHCRENVTQVTCVGLRGVWGVSCTLYGSVSWQWPSLLGQSMAYIEAQILNRNKREDGREERDRRSGSMLWSRVGRKTSKGGNGGEKRGQELKWGKGMRKWEEYEEEERDKAGNRGEKEKQKEEERWRQVWRRNYEDRRRGEINKEGRSSRRE